MTQSGALIWSFVIFSMTKKVCPFPYTYPWIITQRGSGREPEEVKGKYLPIMAAVFLSFPCGFFVSRRLLGLILAFTATPFPYLSLLEYKSVRFRVVYTQGQSWFAACQEEVSLLCIHKYHSPMITTYLKSKNRNRNIISGVITCFSRHSSPLFNSMVPCNYGTTIPMLINGRWMCVLSWSTL